MDSNREVLEKTVRENPGIGFSQLKRETGLSNGVIQYHLTKSEIIQKKNKAYMEKEFCRSCQLSGRCNEECLLKHIRKKKNKKIIEELGKGRSQKKVAEKIERDRSTVNYHVKKLEDIGLLENGKPVFSPDEINV